MDIFTTAEKILASSPDPLDVRKSTYSVIKNMRSITINDKAIEKVAELVKDKVGVKQTLDEGQFGSNSPTPQLIFVMDTVNFCFWANKYEEKWSVEFPQGNIITGGWYGLVGCFERAREEGIPITDANYLKDLDLKQAEHIFRSANNTPIPLLKERVQNLNETGKILSEKFDGNIENLLLQTEPNAGEITKAIIDNFPSYEDSYILNNHKVNFHKRAQIFTYDIVLLSSSKITATNTLAAFADYKIPQMLRKFGVIEYMPKLAEKIDNYIILENGSLEEIEIRAATIWACELIANQAKIEPVLVDNVLWKMSQDLTDVKPYHRVRTTYY